MTSGLMENHMQADVGPGAHLEVCRTCLATDCKMFPMTFSTVLNDAYGTLTETKITVESIQSVKELNTSFSGDSIGKPTGTSNGGLIEVNELCYAQDGTRVEVELYNNIDDLKSEIDHAIDHNRDNDDLKSEIDNAIDHNRDSNEDTINDVAGDDVKVENDNLSSVEGLNACTSSSDENIVVDNVVADNNDIINDDDHNSSISDDDIVVDHIIAQNDMINRGDVSECSFGSEPDVDVDFVTIDNVVNNEVITSKSLVYSATSYEDSVCDVLRMEHSDISNTTSTFKARETVSDYAKPHAVYSVGEKVLASPCVILEQGQKDNMVQASREMHFNRRQTPEADGGTVPSADDTLSCDICQYHTVSVIQLLEHLKAHAANPDHCDACSYKTNEKRKLRVHVRTHFDDKQYFCNICKIKFNHKQSLAIHMKIHLGKKSHVCDICKERFRLKRELSLHLATHSGGQLRSCDVCQKTFVKYSCDICKSSFTEKGNLRKHLMIHSATKTYPCDICKKQFKRKHQLERHVLIHRRHSAEKSYSCVDCYKTFNTKKRLRDHSRVQCGKRYLCDICGRVFTSQDPLNSHIRVHFGETPVIYVKKHSGPKLA